MATSALCPVTDAARETMVSILLELKASGETPRDCIGLLTYVACALITELKPDATPDFAAEYIAVLARENMLIVMADTTTA